MSSIRPFTLAISATALVVMTACGSNTTTPSAAPTSSATTSSATSSPSTTASAPAGPATVKVSTTKLGDVLSDSRGFALYKFVPDKNGVSVCYEANDCAAKWPPLLTTGAPKADAGANAAMLGTTTRKDGATQVTYNKMPLYFFAQDKAPGDVNGQGLGGIWWLVASNGTDVKKTAS